MNDILDTLLTASQTQFSTTFRTYLKGILLTPAMDDMPIFTIYGIGETQEHEGTLRDKAVFTIGIDIYISIKQYLDNTAGQGTAIDTMAALIDLVADRDSDGMLVDSSVMGIINNNLQASGKVLYTDNMEAKYSQYLTANNFPAGKATVTFKAYTRPTR